MVFNRKRQLEKFPIDETLCLCRVSSFDQAKDGNINSQKQSCESFAKARGFKIDRFFDEDGISGWKNGVKRIGLDAIQEEIERAYKKGKRTRVIAFSLSRYGRNSIRFASFYETVERYEAELLCVSEKVDTTTAKGKRDIIVGVADAEYDSGKKSEESVCRMKERLLDGYYQFNLPPGLKYDDRNEIGRKPVIRDEPRATYVLQAFEKFASGELPTKKSVAEYLRSFPVWGKKKNSENSIKDMLENKVYTGFFPYEPWDIEPQEWKVEKLIPMDLFNRVQKRLKRGGKGTYRSDKSEDFPLRHEIFCDCCGCPLTGYYSQGRNRPYPYYRCYNNQCENRNKSFNRADVENAFVERLIELKADDDVLDLFIAYAQKTGKIKDENDMETRQRLQKQISELDGQIGSYAKLIAKAVDDEDMDMLSIFKTQIKAANNKKNDLESKLKDVPVEFIATEKFRTALERGREFLKNPRLLWENGNLNQKRKVPRVLFIENPRYSPENGFRTAATPWIFNKNTAQTDGKCDLAVPTGFEPVFSP